MKKCYPHDWHKWEKPEPQSDYSADSAMWSTRFVQFRECVNCGEAQARFVTIAPIDQGSEA